MSEQVTCPYCNGIAPLVTGREVYPHRTDLYGKQFYACLPCGAWVGCHPGTTKPLGRLADTQLRSAKMSVHAVLDPLWKSGLIKRSSLYARLADHMGIDQRECHVGMFDIDRCRGAVKILQSWNGKIPPRQSPTTRDCP